MALHVGDGAPDEGTRQEDAAREVGMRDVDPGVDDRDLDRRETNWRLGPKIEGAVLLQVPLLRGKRIGRHEGDTALA